MVNISMVILYSLTVVHIQVHRFVSSNSISGLGCNRPSLCAIKDVLNDESCTASEPAIDDGLMCNSCKTPV